MVTDPMVHMVRRFQPLNKIAKIALIGCLAILPACAVPPNETATQRAKRINRGTTVVAALVAVTIVSALVLEETH